MGAGRGGELGGSRGLKAGGGEGAARRWGGAVNGAGERAAGQGRDFGGSRRGGSEREGGNGGSLAFGGREARYGGAPATRSGHPYPFPPAITG